MFDTFLAITCGTLGVLCGWLIQPITFNLAHADREGEVDHEEEHAPPAPAPAAAEVQQTRDVVDQSAEALLGGAEDLVAGVLLHQDRVDAVERTLKLAPGQTANAETITRAIIELTSANESMRQELQTARHRIEEQSDQLRAATRSANTDALTGLPNRGRFDELLGQADDPARAPAVLGLIDIDHFKRVNDTLGHRAGDEVLRRVAKAIAGRLGGGAVVARYGGEEFGLLLGAGESPARPDHWIERAESVRATVQRLKIDFEGQTISVTCSLGLATRPNGQSTSQWLEAADRALYHSKSEGRNRGHRLAEGKMFPLTKPPAAEVATPRVSPVEILRDLRRRPRPTAPAAMRYVNTREAFAAAMRTPGGSGSARPMVMALRLPENATGADLRSLVQVVRAAVDQREQVGCLDHHQLVIGWKTATAEVIEETARQIQNAAASIGLVQTAASPGEPSRNLGVGIVGVEASSGTDSSADVDLAIDRAVAMAIYALSDPSGRSRPAVWPGE